MVLHLWSRRNRGVSFSLQSILHPLRSRLPVSLASLLSTEQHVIPKRQRSCGKAESFSLQLILDPLRSRHLIYRASLLSPRFPKLEKLHQWYSTCGAKETVASRSAYSRSSTRFDQDCRFVLRASCPPNSTSFQCAKGVVASRSTYSRSSTRFDRDCRFVVQASCPPGLFPILEKQHQWYSTSGTKETVASCSAYSQSSTRFDQDCQFALQASCPPTSTSFPCTKEVVAE